MRPSSFKTPSNTTLRLENGELTHVPPQLKKTTPNFHLIMPAEKDTDAFCKTTLSAMILNYPPPTVINFHRKFKSDSRRARDTLQGIRHYLNNVKYVQDDDLVLIVDSENSWFQLPSDVIIKQYTKVLEDANARLLKQYGTDNEGHQKYNQTIVFGASKICAGDDMACKLAPSSILPANLYGKEASVDMAHRPARYLDSKMLMGPARDLKLLYQVALTKLDLETNHKRTMQHVFATMFAEQQARRDASKKTTFSPSAKFASFSSTRNPTPSPPISATSSNDRPYTSQSASITHTPSSSPSLPAPQTNSYPSSTPTPTPLLLPTSSTLPSLQLF
jgi:hypothetical protein